MKKLVLTLIFLISVFSFSLEKSGIKEFDDLDLSKGKIIAYFSDKKKIVEEEYAMFYRKEYGKKDNLYLIVDFYADTDTPEKFFKLKDLDNDDSMNGKLAYYDKDEKISYTADMKDGRINGSKTSFEDGKVAAVVNFTNNLANGKGILYYKDKKYVEANYTHGFIDGDFTLFYPDGTKVLTQTYDDNEVQKSKNIGYKLQKTGVAEYDNIDFSKGEITGYFTAEGNLISQNSKEAVFFRKIFAKEGNLYLMVDYFKDTGNVQGIGKGTNLKDFQGRTIDGPVFTFYDNGRLKSKAFFKDKKIDGESVLYDYNGEPTRIETYSDGKLDNIKFLNR